VRSVLKIFGIVTVVLFIVGAVTGVVGAKVFGHEPLLPTPEFHIAPQTIFHLGAFKVTNTLLSAWLTTVVLVVFFAMATRRMALVPKGLQNVVEVVVEQLYNFVVSVVGEDNGRRFFPLIATIFLFVAFNAWIALLPIYPSVGLMYPEGHELAGNVQAHLLRSAGTDLNMPLALGVISLLAIEIYGLKAHGRAYLSEFIRVKTLARGIRRLNIGMIFMGAIDAFVGVLEIFSHGTRVLSFTFRLFGNMTAGEIVLTMSTFLASFVVSIVFYGLELLVGFVQALIFAGLTLAFIHVAVTPHEEEAHD
jgi:F-type H+-transporting ATPase subunit a